MKDSCCPNATSASLRARRHRGPEQLVYLHADEISGSSRHLLIPDATPHQSRKQESRGDDCATGGGEVLWGKVYLWVGYLVWAGRPLGLSAHPDPMPFLSNFAHQEVSDEY